MNFTLLPEHIGEKILRYLPFKERVRIARVDRRFNYLSDLVVSGTAELNLMDEQFKDITSSSLSKLLQLCANDLNAAAFIPAGYLPPPAYSSIMNERMEEFLNFRYAHLVTLNIDRTTVDAKRLGKLLIHCPALRRLRITSCEFEGELLAVACNELETLVIFPCPIGIFKIMIDCCPKLKEINFRVGDTSDEWGQAINVAFSKWPLLETLHLYLGHGGGGMRLWASEMGNVSSLQSLRFLKIVTSTNEIIFDDLMYAICVNLVHLERLMLYARFESWVGISAVRWLKNLRQVVLGGFLSQFGYDLSLDYEIRKLAWNTRLEEIEFAFWLSPQTVFAFTQNCPRLNELILENVHGIESEDEAETFIQGLKGFVQQNLTIRLSVGINTDMWRAERVQAELDKVNQAAQGRKIYFVVPPPPAIDDDDD